MKIIYLRFINFFIGVYKQHYPFAVFIALIFILFFPVLFLKKLWPGSDPLLTFYPYSFHYFNNMSHWDTSILSGVSIGALPASFAGNWIYYKIFSFSFLDFIGFYNILIFFYFILTAAFSYAASRKIGFDKLVSVLVTSVYIFSAYNLSWMVNIVTAPSLFIFPALVYFLLKFKEEYNWFWSILGGIFLGLSLTMGQPQFVMIAALGGFLFSLFLILPARNESPRWKFLAAFLVICIIGFALSAFQLISEYRSIQLSQRSAALTFQDSQVCALGIPDFARYLVPNFNFGVSCESLLYVGVLPLILAIFAIFNFKNDQKKYFFWSFLLAFSILFSLKYSPLAWIFHQLPIWQNVRGPGRFLMLGNFSLAVLAGYGFNWILKSKESLKELKIFVWIKQIFWVFLSVLIIINVLGLFKNTFIKWATAYFNKYYYTKTIGLPIEHYHRSIENLISANFYTFNFLNKDFAAPFVLTAVAFLIIIYIKKFDKTVLFYITLLSGFIWAITSPMVSSGLRRDFFDETPVIQFLKNQKQPFRIYSLLPNLSAYQLVALRQGAAENDQNEFLKITLPANLNLVHGLDSIDGYEQTVPRRTSRILAELLSERAPLGNKIAEARLKPGEKIKIFENRANLLRMMNVKYIISAYSLDEKVFKKVFETKITRFDVPIYIYENKNILPRFYFAKSTKSIESDELKALNQILAPDIDFKAVSLIECGGNCGYASGGEILDFEYKNGYLRLNTENQIDNWLVFSESYNSGWLVRINDEAAPIYRANYVYQAVKVPAGKNIIEFKYK